MKKGKKQNADTVTSSTGDSEIKFETFSIDKNGTVKWVETKFPEPAPARNDTPEHRRQSRGISSFAAKRIDVGGILFAFAEFMANGGSDPSTFINALEPQVKDWKSNRVDTWSHPVPSALFDSFDVGGFVYDVIQNYFENRRCLREWCEDEAETVDASVGQMMQDMSPYISEWKEVHPC